MNNYSVIFAGTCRDVQQYIEPVLKHIDKCGEKFKKYTVIIYENDSIDKTRELLLKNKKENYIYIFDDNVTEKRRTMRLANGRNKILRKIRKINKNKEYDYLINLDLDDVNRNGKFVDSIENCFKYDVNTWDVMTGYQNNDYYDLWALRMKPILEVDCWMETGMNIREIHYIVNNYINQKRKEKEYLIKVDSSFGGIAVYKLSIIPEHCKYIGEKHNGNQHCEHVEFHRAIRQNGGIIFLNTEFYTS
jgi:hypothetical protein